MLLVLQRLGQATAAALAGLAILALLDYALRLPVPVRMGLLALLGAAVLGWLGKRLWAALQFRPSLADLALRAERMYPHLRGSLASAVEFSEQAGAYANPARTGALAAAARDRVAGQIEARQLRQLLAPRATWVALAVAGTLLVGLAVVGSLAPQFSGTALARWFTPWAGAEWPKRTQIASLTGASAWSADQPLTLRAAIRKGHYPRMRVTAYYRLIDNDGRAGAWQRVLMSEQTPERRANEAQATLAPRYEQLVELAERAPAANENGQRGRIAYYFTAGDDRTETEQVALIERPTVTAVRVAMTPPRYARSLLETEHADLHARSQQMPTARGLEGSTVRFEIVFNKPLHVADGAWGALVPGLPSEAQVALDTAEGAEGAEAAGARRVAYTFPLRESVRTAVELVDRHGFANLSERRYALEAIPDEPPAVSILEPRADQSVLAEARIELEALVQDDVGAESIALEAQVPGEADSRSRETTSVRELGRRSGQEPRLTLAHTLDLADFALEPGDVVTLTALGRDIYELNGKRHERVRSTPRRLRIIDAGTLAGELRGELAGVRRQAIRMDAEQGRLAEQSPSEAQPRQGRLTDRLAAQRALVEGLIERAERNRLEAASLNDTMAQARALLEEAGTASEAAQRAMEAADDDAPAQQDAVRAALSELVSLLDQGEDALARRLELQRLRTTQRNLEAQTRELLPQTVGESLENLPAELREQLEALAERQRRAASEAEALVREMRSTAAALAQQDRDEESRAAADTLAEAADLAQREGLSERMGESSQAIDENQLSRAGQEQSESLDVMDRMLSELGQQEQRRQAMLRRHLADLAEQLERLIERQRNQLAALDGAEDVSALSGPQRDLRRATLAASELAGQSETTAPAVDVIDEAVARQGQAIGALRASEAEAARQAEQRAVAHLEEAIELVRQQCEELAQEQADQQREELKAEYEQLADRQDALRAQVNEVLQEREQAAGEGLTRRQRAALVQRGHEQSDIRTAASKLRERVEDALLFQHLHDRLDQAAREVVERLRSAEADDALTDRQQRIAGDLRRMAAVLEQATGERADFAGQQGGGGGGGQAQEPPLVPPMAELRLLRSLQAAVLEETRALAGVDDAARARLMNLSTEQRSLSELGEQLIEQMNEQRRQMEGAAR